MGLVMEAMRKIVSRSIGQIILDVARARMSVFRLTVR